MIGKKIGRVFTIFGETFASLRAVERHYGVDRGTIKQRLSKGFTVEEAVTKPVRPQRKGKVNQEGKKLCVNCRKPIEVTGNKWGHCIPCQRRYQAEKKRGVPRGTYVFLWERQKGKCLCCGVSLRDLTERSPHIDHCHETGKIRGLLCHYCNTSLGIIHESHAHAISLANYIKNHCDPLKERQQ